MGVRTEIRSRFERVFALNPENRRRFERYRSGLRTFLDNTTAVIALLVILFYVGMAILAPHIALYPPEEPVIHDDGAPTLEEPSLRHPMGTTQFANDVFSQWVYGSRVSVLVGIASGFVVLVVGTTVGVMAGYYRGLIDMALMRLVDVLYGLPGTPLILVLALFIGASLWNVVLAMMLVLWRTMARLTRSQTLSLAQRPYVRAARATGASDFRIMTRYIIPNLLPIMLIETTLVAGGAILLEAGVSFLGYGAQSVSWGTMLQATFTTGAIRHAWWWVLPPGLSIASFVIAIFYLARGIEEVTNPELTRDDVK